ncbi:MAG: methyltransferase domain-containing protein [Candidatus Caldarchaeum sp.]
MISIDSSSQADADIICAVLGGLPFRAHTFQTVICTSVLEHASDAELAIHEIHRVLTQGEYLLIPPHSCSNFFLARAMIGGSRKKE